MKTYELIIERHQPPCGGKPAKVVEVRSEDQEQGAIPLLKEEAEAHNDVHDQNLLKMKYRHHQSRSPYQLAPEKSGLK